MELNVRHREALKPELHMNYRYLCDPSNPVTAEQFGDDMPTVVKDITDANRITSKLYNQKTDNERRGRSELRPDRFQGHKTSSGTKKLLLTLPSKGGREEDGEESTPNDPIIKHSDTLR